jgi:hypothetical protein
MALANEKEGASAPSFKMCAEDGCGRLQWTTEKRGRRFVHSDFCYECANVPMFDVPAEPGRTSKPTRRSPAAVFRKEVERQRLARERQPKDAA